MANHYLQFSEAILHLSIAERKWLQAQLETIYSFGDREYAEGKVPKRFATVDADWCGCRALRDCPGVESDEEAGFQFKFLKEAGLGRYLWLYAEEVGNPDRVAHLVQKFLRQFRPHECWALTYATTCSKPRLGEFGGGAVFVKADAIQQQDAYGFLSHCRETFSPTVAC